MKAPLCRRPAAPAALLLLAALASLAPLLPAAHAGKAYRHAAAVVLVAAALSRGCAADEPGEAFGSAEGVQRALPQPVGIVVVADKRFQGKMALMLATQRAFAQQHGYAFKLLDPAVDAPACASAWGDFFFRKHCAVRKYLAAQEAGFALLVLDADVVAASSTASLAAWLADPADVVLYERSWNFEITAGNYLVRNTAFGRHFLDVWYGFYFWAHVVSGYSSSDNGAIHLVLLQLLAPVLPRDAFAACTRQYLALRAPIGDLVPYYSFVGCTRRVLGPARRWVVGGGPVPGRVTVLNRYHGFALDGHMFGNCPNARVPFVHGQKDAGAAQKAYGFGFRVTLAAGEAPASHVVQKLAAAGTWQSNAEVWNACAFDPRARCELRMSARAWTVDELGGHVSRGDMHQARTSTNMPWVIGGVPRMYLGECARNFSCAPAAMESTAPARDLFENNQAARAPCAAALWDVGCLGMATEAACEECARAATEAAKGVLKNGCTLPRAREQCKLAANAAKHGSGGGGGGGGGGGSALGGSPKLLFACRRYDLREHECGPISDAHVINAPNGRMRVVWKP